MSNALKLKKTKVGKPWEARGRHMYMLNHFITIGIVSMNIIILILEISDQRLREVYSHVHNHKRARLTLV